MRPSGRPVTGWGRVRHLAHDSTSYREAEVPGGIGYQRVRSASRCSGFSAIEIDGVHRMSNGRDELQRMSDMLTVWQLVGMMGLDGRLTLDETKLLTESLVVWSSYVRNQGNKTWTARELGESRRVIRSIIRRWEGTGGDTRALPMSLRRWVLGEGNPSVIGASAHALQADVEHELRSSRGGAISETGNRLAMEGTVPLALPAATTIDVHAEDARPSGDRSAEEPASDRDPSL